MIVFFQKNNTPLHRTMYLSSKLGRYNFFFITLHFCNILTVYGTIWAVQCRHRGCTVNFDRKTIGGVAVYTRGATTSIYVLRSQPPGGGGCCPEPSAPIWPRFVFWDWFGRNQPNFEKPQIFSLQDNCRFSCKYYI